MAFSTWLVTSRFEEQAELVDTNKPSAARAWTKTSPLTPQSHTEDMGALAKGSP